MKVYSKPELYSENVTANTSICSSDCECAYYTTAATETTAYTTEHAEDGNQYFCTGISRYVTQFERCLDP